MVISLEDNGGEWRDGLKNGKGTQTWNDGTKYVGEYKNDKKMVKEHIYYFDGQHIG